MDVVVLILLCCCLVLAAAVDKGVANIVLQDLQAATKLEQEQQQQRHWQQEQQQQENCGQQYADQVCGSNQLLLWLAQAVMMCSVLRPQRMTLHWHTCVAQVHAVGDVCVQPSSIPDEVCKQMIKVSHGGGPA